MIFYFNYKANIKYIDTIYNSGAIYNNMEYKTI